MSIVSTVVHISQFLRVMADRMQAKAINAVEKRIKQVEKEQRQVEQHRSKLMIDCHNCLHGERDARCAEYQKAKGALQAKFNKDMDKIAGKFEENRRTVALTSQAASNELKRELAMLGSELDHLTK